MTSPISFEVPQKLKICKDLLLLNCWRTVIHDDSLPENYKIRISFLRKVQTARVQWQALIIITVGIWEFMLEKPWVNYKKNDYCGEVKFKCSKIWIYYFSFHKFGCNQTGKQTTLNMQKKLHENCINCVAPPSLLTETECITEDMECNSKYIQLKKKKKIQKKIQIKF